MDQTDLLVRYSFMNKSFLHEYIYHCKLSFRLDFCFIDQLSTKYQYDCKLNTCLSISGAFVHLQLISHTYSKKKVMQTAFHTSHKKIFHFWFWGDLSKTWSVFIKNSHQCNHNWSLVWIYLKFCRICTSFESDFKICTTHKCINSHYTIKLHGKQVLCLNEHILEFNVEMVQFVWILKGFIKL